MILIEILIASLTISALSGGSLRRLANRPLRGQSILVVLLPVQMLWPAIAEKSGMKCDYALLAWVLMMASLSVVLMVNAPRSWSLGVAALGIAANILVIGLNQAMPVSIRSTSEIGGDRYLVRSALKDDCLHEELGKETSLPWLGDVIAIPGPSWQRSVVSPGDVLLAIGLGLWVFQGGRPEVGEGAPRRLP